MGSRRGKARKNTFVGKYNRCDLHTGFCLPWIIFQPLPGFHIQLERHAPLRAEISALLARHRQHGKNRFRAIHQAQVNGKFGALVQELLGAVQRVQQPKLRPVLTFSLLTSSDSSLRNRNLRQGLRNIGIRAVIRLRYRRIVRFFSPHQRPRRNSSADILFAKFRKLRSYNGRQLQDHCICGSAVAF